MNERRKNKWVQLLSDEERARARRVEELLSERSGIERQMAACRNLLSDEYSQLQRQLRENTAKIATT